jgi:hypothetical protein
MLVGIVPMGGYAARWAPYPCPKEMLPVGIDVHGRPRVIADYVLLRMQAADVDMVVVPVRPEKAEVILGYFGSRLPNGAPIVYLAASGTSLLDDLQMCVPIIRYHRVLFGMPDTFFLPEDAFCRCLDLLHEPAELVIGGFLHNNPAAFDVIERKNHHLTAVHPKPHTYTAPGEIWGIAAWEPAVTEQLQHWGIQQGTNPGYLFHAVAIAGRAHCVVFQNGQYEDMGSYQVYERFLSTWLQQHQDDPGECSPASSIRCSEY